MRATRGRAAASVVRTLPHGLILGRGQGVDEGSAD
jgi:hypothetical protein